MKKEEETLLVERALTGDVIAFKKLVSPLKQILILVLVKMVPKL